MRYFNPIGAHSSGLIGENPKGSPNNIFPHLIRVASRKDQIFNIFGGDWPTKDGTGIRDYIHVMDLAEGHIKALDYSNKKEKSFLVLNLGTGKGTSVFELINTFERVNNLTLNYEIASRRYGDVAEYYADCKKAKEIIGWSAKRSLDDICKDGWKWQNENRNR